jgi:Bacterial Ig-like domain (group 1)
LQPISNTGRWLHGGIGAGAAIATILASAHSCGLLGAEGSRLSVTNLAVHWVGLTPVADTAESLGDTLRFVATVTDRRGATLVGATLNWESEDTTVATVDSAGFVVARGAGITQVLTRAGERVAKGRVVVRPRVARMQLDPDTLLIAEGTERGITALAFDAREHPVTRRVPHLASSDTSVASLQGDRLLTLAPGRAIVTGTIDGASDSIVVEVTPVPARLLPVRGMGQRAPVGTRLGEPIVIRVEARAGRPMPGVVVGFTPAAGSGPIEPDSAVTDERGLATARWTLGDSPGLQRLTASVTGLDSVATLEAEAEPVAANTRISPIEDSLRGPAGGAALTAGIRVTDSTGRMLPGVPVGWSALDGGQVEARAGRTDSLGESRIEWRLGPRSGPQRVRAVVGTGRGVPPRILTAVALPGSPAHVGLAGTVPKAAAAGALLPGFQVRVTDAAGNSVPGVPITVVSSSGAVSESGTVTDGAGRATVRWTLGRSVGDQRLTISTPKLPPLVVTVAGRAGAVANVAFQVIPTTAPAGKRLLKPIQVRLTDVYGNPVPDQLVVLQPSSGSVSPSRAMTDKAGSAVTNWILGSKAGIQRLTASVPKTGIKQTIEIEAIKPR